MNVKLKAPQVDAKALGKVAVLMGGRSAEREVSLMSGGGVLKALQSRGVDAHAFDTAERDLSELKHDGFQRCFIALHGRFGEDGTVQGALELLGIPYTGPGVMASAVAMDKLMTKRIWMAEGLSTPAWRQVKSAAETRAAFATLGSPMIVKPVREGSTIGLTKVLSRDRCEAAWCAAVGSTQDDQQEHQGHHDFRHETGCQRVFTGRMLAITIRGQSRGHVEARLPACNEQQYRGCSDGTQHLRDDVGHEVLGGETSANHQADRHGWIQMTARNVANGIGHRQHRESERQRHADQADADIRKRGR